MYNSGLLTYNITTYCRQILCFDVTVVCVELQVYLVGMFYVSYIQLLENIVWCRICIDVCKHVFIALVRIHR